MIHAYLFVTNNNSDRDGHGPTFCLHMNRINKEAGTNITVIKTIKIQLFVSYYQQNKKLVTALRFFRSTTISMTK